MVNASWPEELLACTFTASAAEQWVSHGPHVAAMHALLSDTLQPEALAASAGGGAEEGLAAAHHGAAPVKLIKRLSSVR